MPQQTDPSVGAIEDFHHRDFPAAPTQRPERQRDVLFGAGCGLLCFGLFPFSASASISANDPSGTSSSDQAAASFLADEFDPLTKLLSRTFSCVGLACVTLSCIVLARSKLRVALVAVVIPLVVCITISSRTILVYSTVDDVVNVLRNTRVISYDQDIWLERSINDLYCEAQAQQLCVTGDAARAKSDFGIYSWQDMESTCARIDREHVPNDLDPLTLISQPTVASLYWCGQYVSTYDLALDTSESPYQQHRSEVLDHVVRTLAWRQARVKLLMVLEWFALPALLGALWWWKAPSPKVQVSGYHAVPTHVVV